jgi:hypothetical protein
VLVIIICYVTARNNQPGSALNMLLKSPTPVRPGSFKQLGMANVTKRGNMVLDTFLRSTSPLIVAEETGRISNEFAPFHFEVPIRRRRQNMAVCDHALWLDRGQRFNTVVKRPRTVSSETADGR